MKRSSTLVRIAALACIAVVVGAIVTTNMVGSPVVAANYLVRSDVLVTELAEPVSDVAVEISTLTDWEYTLRGRPPKCRFIP